MANDQPYRTSESLGIDAAYEARRDDAQRELADTMAGPRHPLKTVPADGVKDPHGEFETPSRMTTARPSRQDGPGPDKVGNSSGTSPVDPQGQQGGTEGGQAGSPPSTVRGRAQGGPLASPDERGHRSN
jgi:hypothetical protein